MGVATGTMPDPAPAKPAKVVPEPLEARVIDLEKRLTSVEKYLEEATKPAAKGKSR